MPPWTTTEVDLASKAWRAGMCARCVSKLLAMHGYQRSYRAVQMLHYRYPQAKRPRTIPGRYNPEQHGEA